MADAHIAPRRFSRERGTSDAQTFSGSLSGVTLTQSESENTGSHSDLSASEPRTGGNRLKRVPRNSGRSRLTMANAAARDSRLDIMNRSILPTPVQDPRLAIICNPRISESCPPPAQPPQDPRLGFMNNPKMCELLPEPQDPRLGVMSSPKIPELPSQDPRLGIMGSPKISESMLQAQGPRLEIIHKSTARDRYLQIAQS